MVHNIAGDVKPSCCIGLLGGKNGLSVWNCLWKQTMFCALGQTIFLLFALNYVILCSILQVRGAFEGGGPWSGNYGRLAREMHHPEDSHGGSWGKNTTRTESKESRGDRKLLHKAEGVQSFNVNIKCTWESFLRKRVLKGAGITTLTNDIEI